jgi:hypothetical protein
MHWTLTLFITPNLEKHNLIEQTNFPWPPILPKQRECILHLILRCFLKLRFIKIGILFDAMLKILQGHQNKVGIYNFRIICYTSLYLVVENINGASFSLNKTISFSAVLGKVPLETIFRNITSSAASNAFFQTLFAHPICPQLNTSGAYFFPVQIIFN